MRTYTGRSLAAVAVMLATAWIPAASAEPMDPVGENYAGLPCGTNRTEDPTRPGTVVAELDGGPWFVLGASSVTVECAIRLDSPDAPVTISVSRTTSGMVGSVGAIVEYAADAGQATYVCTAVSWTYDDLGPLVTAGSNSHDFSPAGPGGECYEVL